MSVQNMERFFAAWGESFESVIAAFDEHLADDGTLIASFPVMGALELDADGRIAAWREFFDPRAALELLSATPAATV